MALESVLSPPFLVRNINVIALIIAGFVLVIFDEITTRAAFSFADSIRVSTQRKISRIGRKKNSRTIRVGSSFFSNSLSTAIILLYCYFGTTVLAYYVFAPILSSLRDIILIIVVIAFMLISYVINDKDVRERLRGLG